MFSGTALLFCFIALFLLAILVATILHRQGKVAMELQKTTVLRLQKRLIRLANMLRLARYSANHDVLTGLPNRRLFNDRLQQAMTLALRHDRELSILMIDLDGFKAINDELGHASGDKVLQQVAERLARCLRASDTAARLGGDEFIVMLQETTGPVSIMFVIEKIRHSLAAPYPLAKRMLTVGASMGVTAYRGESQLLAELMA